jgi:hypothetical protein
MINQKDSTARTSGQKYTPGAAWWQISTALLPIDLLTFGEARLPRRVDGAGSPDTFAQVKLGTLLGAGYDWPMCAK